MCRAWVHGPYKGMHIYVPQEKEKWLPPGHLGHYMVVGWPALSPSDGSRNKHGVNDANSQHFVGEVVYICNTV